MKYVKYLIFEKYPNLKVVHFCLNDASLISFGQYDENDLGNHITKYGEDNPIISAGFHDFKNGDISHK